MSDYFLWINLRKFMMWDLKGFKKPIGNVSFYLTHNNTLLSRCEDTQCTRRYLVKQPVQVLQQVEKR